MLATFDSSYPTGGESLIPRDFGMHRFHHVSVFPDSPSTTSYVVAWDRTNDTLKVYQSAGGTPAGTISGTAAAQTITAVDSSRLEVYTQGDIKGSANTDSAAADAASAPTNGVYLEAAATFTALAGTLTPNDATIDVARNVVLTIENPELGTVDLFEGTSVYTITGTFRGAAQVETLNWTSTAGNMGIATTKFRYLYGVKPFDSVTTVTWTNAPTGTLKLGLGLGSKVGLPINLDTPTEADVKKINKNAANLSPASIVDAVNMTVNLGTLANDDDFSIEYAVDIDTIPGTTAGTSTVTATFTGSAVSAAALSEVAASTNLSSLVVYLEAIGV
jgi:hypothetical protein